VAAVKPPPSLGLERLMLDLSNRALLASTRALLEEIILICNKEQVGFPVRLVYGLLVFVDEQMIAIVLRSVF
jgi:hypothetical protein